jgi:2-keto-3-deoxy-L-rhamnonate aldolase RhmA
MAARRGTELAFWLETPSLAACEIAALVGYHLVVLDMEHGTITSDTLDPIVAHCRVIKLGCYVRVAAGVRHLIQQALDSGADAVVVPQIADLSEAERASAYAKYPPLGSRGVGYSRTMNYGVDDIDDRFFEAENKRTKCHVMIETPGALRDVESILRLETVDGVFIGPSDLSMTRGRGAFKFTPEDKQDFRTIATVVRNAKKSLGLPASNAESYAFAVSIGADYVTINDDLTALRVGFLAGIKTISTR